MTQTKATDGEELWTTVLDDDNARVGSTFAIAITPDDQIVAAGSVVDSANERRRMVALLRP